MTAQIEKREMGNLIIEGIPEIPQWIDQKLLQYENTRETSLIGWSDHGQSILMMTRFAEAPQVHRVKMPGGAREQLTFFDEPIYNGQVRPGPEQGFLFSKDHGGSELFQLYYFDLDRHEVHRISDGQSKNGPGIWNKDGSAFVYTSTRRNAVDHDLYLVEFEGAQIKETCLMENTGLWYPIDWNPQGTAITVGHYRSISDNQLYQFDLGRRQLSPLFQEAGEVANRGGLWGADGKKIFYTSDAIGDFRQLYCLDIDTQQSRLVLEMVNWNVEGVSLHPDGSQLALSLNVDGYSKIMLVRTSDFASTLLDKVPQGVIEGITWHPTEHRFAFCLNQPTAPADLFEWNTETETLTQWTYSEVGGLKSEHFVSPQLIHYNSFEEENGVVRQIPAFYFKPNTKKTKYPVLIFIHGGPESQYRPIFSPMFQYYINELEIAVLAPNVRGSTGYGKQYIRLDNGYLREDSVKDIGKLLDWVDEQPELDSKRIAVIGGSYGGYMVLSSMTHFNDRLRCGIDIVGISNFITFLENTKSYRRALRRMEYGDERDPKMRRHLEKISPITNAHKIKKPLLIVQGMNDPRVPASEAEQMLEAIRKNGGEAWYLLAKDEGHGFRKKSNRDYYTKAVILFLQRYLLN
jgi:dipeptidyl aminopeptidase/acylaminoacyl peptidase